MAHKYLVADSGDKEQDDGLQGQTKKASSGCFSSPRLEKLFFSGREMVIDHESPQLL